MPGQMYLTVTAKSYSRLCFLGFRHTGPITLDRPHFKQFSLELLSTQIVPLKMVGSVFKALSTLKFHLPPLY